ncbi:hypothetical protein DL546_004326 [Coniochaeta pulveracea]|uniref:Uncharacterized protein n=1 Tax=Coniochaeta pulveracea TaxID=177199 RepID=A0A420XZI2_9PEZI|nr:hypothetical protein DL546_004326 [Coniochaeta pulveracea]
MESHLGIVVVVVSNPLSRQELSVSSSARGKFSDEDSRSFDGWGFHGWKQRLLRLLQRLERERRRLQTPKDKTQSLERQMKTHSDSELAESWGRRREKASKDCFSWSEAGVTANHAQDPNPLVILGDQ